MSEQSPIAEIFSQGDEIVTGQTVDTNAAWLAEQLVRTGFRVDRHTAVGDRMDDLVALLREISGRADCCICTGGLGPTPDDLTAQAVSQAFDRPLIEDPDALPQIEAHFSRMGRRMPSANRKQALRPSGAARIENEWGTAPGFSLKHDRCFFAFLPGVPFEMKNMFEKSLRPELARRWPVAPSVLVTLRCTGLGESGIQERLESVSIPEFVELGYRTGSFENQVKLRFGAGVPRAEIRTLVEEVAKAIGSPVFGIDGLDADSGDLVAVIGQELIGRRQSVSVLESLSCGRIASRCGCASWFGESRVIREPVRLFTQFGLPFPSDFAHDAMTEAAAALALAMKERSGSDLALAQLWSFDEVGLESMNTAVPVYTALSTPEAVYRYTFRSSGTAPRKQTVAATRALDFLRRFLQGYVVLRESSDL